MFGKIGVTLTAVAAGTLCAGAALAAPITLTGDYLQVSISDYGTFGMNGGGRPAFVHDPTGTGSFDLTTDYIAPGVPHDGFSLISDQFGFTENDNDGPGEFGFNSPSLLTGSAARGYANAVTWSGGLVGFIEVTNSYFFNPGDERVLVETTVTALSDLTNLAFARSVDPDSGGTTSINERGNATFSIDDFIGSESAANGRTLALVNVNDGGKAHSTSIQASCCSNINPYDVLNHTGGDLGLASTGDDGLNLAYLLGTLNNGQSTTFQYAYAVGLGLDDIEDPDDVPAPAALGLLGLGIAGLGALRRRRQPR